MRIALICADAARLPELRGLLEQEAHAVSGAVGGIDRAAALVDRAQPDLLLLDGVQGDPSELRLLDGIAARHPGVAILLGARSQAPAFLIEAMRVGVREVLPSPLERTPLLGALARVAGRLGPAPSRANGKVVAFMSCKGGCGATFLATNLGYELASTRSVLLIDLNLQFGDALSFVHDSKPGFTLADVARDIRRLDASFLASSAVRITDRYSVLAAPDDPSQALEIQPEHVEAVLNQALTQYDFVLLDLGRSIDPLTIKVLDRADRIFLVLQAELPALRNARKLLDAFRLLGYAEDKVEMIVNRYERRAEIGLDDMRRLLGRVQLHPVPNSYREVSAAINHGDPLVKARRSNGVARILAELGVHLNPQGAADPGMIARLFRRTRVAGGSAAGS